MINFNNFTKEEATELFQILQKDVEKSDAEKYYLFTHDTKEKAKLFMFFHRFLCNAENLLEDGKVLNEIKAEIEITQPIYNEINSLNYDLKIEKILAHRIERKLFLAVSDRKVNDLLDAFSLFVEKEVIISMSKLKGFVLEGKSSKEFKKIFSGKKEEVKEETFDDVNEEEEPEEPESEEIEEIVDVPIAEDISEERTNER